MKFDGLRLKEVVAVDLDRACKTRTGDVSKKPRQGHPLRSDTGQRRVATTDEKRWSGLTRSPRAGRKRGFYGGVDALHSVLMTDR